MNPRTYAFLQNVPNRICISNHIDADQQRGRIHDLFAHLRTVAARHIANLIEQKLSWSKGWGTQYSQEYVAEAWAFSTDELVALVERAFEEGFKDGAQTRMSLEKIDADTTD